MTLLPSVSVLRPALRHGTVALAIASVLSGCASAPVPVVKREGRLDGPAAGTSSASTVTTTNANGEIVTTPLSQRDESNAITPVRASARFRKLSAHASSRCPFSMIHFASAVAAT